VHLEVVTHAPKTATRSTALLFVHGAWHMAHDVMLEAGWQSVADRILGLLEEWERSKIT